MKGLDHRLDDDFNRLQKFEKERVKIRGNTMTVTANNGTAQSADADYISFVEELYKSVSHPDTFEDAESMYDEILHIFDSLQKFMKERKEVPR